MTLKIVKSILSKNKKVDKMTKSDKPKILFYDIETTPLQAWLWGLGEQHVRHGQLVKGSKMFNIICITYCWNDEKKAKVIHWDYDKQDSKPMIEEFGRIIEQADITIGKNNRRFDDKRINTMRLLYNMEGMPQWLKSTDDLETQMRRHFAMPSYSLDYASDLFGLGGKIKMEFADWINIMEKNPEGKKSFDKMLKYGKKDIEDTRALWNRMSAHFTPKLNVAALKDKFVCTSCGSSDIKKNGTIIGGSTVYQMYFCKDHGGYAGRHPIGSKTPKLKV